MRPALLVLAFTCAGVATVSGQGAEPARIDNNVEAGVASTAGHASGLAQAADPATDAADAAAEAKHAIVVHRNAGSGNPAAVTLGIPFPPGVLRDPKQVRILDARGTEVPAHVTTSLTWHFKDGSVRAVRVQFHAALDGDTATYHFDYGQARSKNDPGWPYADGLVDGPDGVKVPAVLATLDPAWMTAARITGPQVPATDPPGAYDTFFATQFQWARPMPTTRGAAWLFDRPSTLFEAYVRTGRYDYLQSAVESYRFYMAHIKRSGPNMYPFCGGGFEFESVKACNVKYVYVEPILLALGLTGDDADHDGSVVRLMAGLWASGGWDYKPGPYTDPGQRFTERQAGLGLRAIDAAYALTGDKDYREQIEERIGWLYDHQRNNPDKLGDDGSWRSSWNRHEDDDWKPETDVRGASPWMSVDIVDALWHAWLLTSDPRIPGMLTDFGRYLERYGWIPPEELAKPGQGWRHACDEPDGIIGWYWSSSHATREQLVKIQNSEGWYSDEHNVELTLPVALAMYFEKDPAQRALYDARLKKLSISYGPKCAKSSSTPRRFNWNNHGVGVVQWLIAQPPHQP